MSQLTQKLKSLRTSLIQKNFSSKLKKPSWYTCLMMSKKTKVLLRTEDTKLTKKSPKQQTTPAKPKPN